jgi:hypothetical protein
MGMRWLDIRVELIGGRGQVLDLSPGRSFAVPPGCTFDEFGHAIDLAFARWDLSHLRQFTLEDGTLVVDEEMADELRASVFGGTIPRTILLSAKLGRQLKIDLDELGSTMADRGDYPGGGYVNTQTGEVVPAALTDESTVGEEYVVDVEEGDWEHVVEDSHEGWQDMADFAAAVKDPRSRESLEDAVQGRGAFSRFRRAIDRADLSQEWNCFVDDRRWGRARQELADLGLRPV